MRQRTARGARVEKQTFSKRDRIRSKADFLRLRTGGVRISDGVLMLVVYPTDLGFPRLGIAVPKRIAGAVARNRMRRLIRETFRLNRDKLPGSIDLLVVVQKTPDCPTLEEFRARILSLLSRYPRAGGTDERCRKAGKTDSNTA